jgi:hypothetical protein
MILLESSGEVLLIFSFWEKTVFKVNNSAATQKILVGNFFTIVE